MNVMEDKQYGQNCPYSIFEPFDLMISSLGNYEYSLLGEDWGEYGEKTGYKICKEKDYEKCNLHKNKSLEEKFNE